MVPFVRIPAALSLPELFCLSPCEIVLREKALVPTVVTPPPIVTGKPPIEILLQETLL